MTNTNLRVITAQANGLPPAELVGLLDARTAAAIAAAVSGISAPSAGSIGADPAGAAAAAQAAAIAAAAADATAKIPTAATLSGATTVGRNLLIAPDPGSARTAIGAEVAGAGTTAAAAAVTAAATDATTKAGAAQAAAAADATSKVAPVLSLAQPNGVVSVERAFASREAFITAIGSTPALATLVATEGRDVWFGRYWATGPGVRFRYTVTSTDPTATDPTAIALGGGKWLTQAFGKRVSVLQFGAYCDGGTHDDYPAVQAAATWAMSSATSGLATAVRAIEFPANSYYLSAPIVLGTNGGSYARVSFIGGGARGSTVFVSTTDNSPIWSISAYLMWGMNFTNISYTWSTAADSTKTGRTGFHLGTGGPGDFFNNTISEFVFTNGHYMFDTAGMLFWGNKVSHGQAGSFSGGIYKLTGASGQPNNTLDQIYLTADNAIGPIFQGNGMDVQYRGVEINQIGLNAKILSDTGGGKHAFDAIRLESFNYTTSMSLFDVTNSVLVATSGYMSNGTIGAGVVLTMFSGGNNPISYIDVDNFMANATIGAGSKVVMYGGGGAAGPTTQGGVVKFGHIRTTNLVWNSTLYLTSVDTSAAADNVQVTQWDNPAKTEYYADADVTLSNLAPRVNVFNTALTANRTVFLPYSGTSDYTMWSGRRFEFYKPVAGGGDLILQSNTTVIARIPAAATGHVILSWNRSIPNGQARGWAIASSVIASGGYSVMGDVSATLSAGSSARTVNWATPLTAARTITLSTTLARAGDTFQIVRSAGGSFGLAVGSLVTLSAANQWAMVTFDGTAWQLTACAPINPTGSSYTPQIDVFTSTGTYTRPSWASTVRVLAIGAGGSGGSGRRGAAATVRCGGGGGGGGNRAEATYAAADLTATVAVTIGTSGTPGTAQTTDSTDGVAGSGGGSSTFGAYLFVGRGGHGGAGTATAGTAGAAVGGVYPSAAGGSASATGGAGNAGSAATIAGSGGGAGGGITSADVANAGGNAFETTDRPSAGAVAGGANTGANGANGTARLANEALGGNGGAGGGANLTGAGGTGGNGGIYGGGGGGGGASLNGNASGAGGLGGPSIIVVISS